MVAGARIVCAMAQVERIPLEPVDAMTVTTLVDNVTDILLADEGPARRPPVAQVLVSRRRFLSMQRHSTRYVPSMGLPRW
jgi:hypothetical protein